MSKTSPENGRRPFVRTKGPKPTWTEAERQSLREQVRALRKELRRPLRPADLRRVRIRKRTYYSVKSQAARLGLYKPTRTIQRWTVREEQMLVLLAKKRNLGARGIKSRGFFSGSGEGTRWFANRSLDSIAQKKRRQGLVDPKRSWRARYAKRLSTAERKKLKRELEKNSRKRSNEEFAQEYGVSASTIRRYRKTWSIRQSWAEAMALPRSLEKRAILIEQTRNRNHVRWKRQKAELLDKLERRKARLAKKRGKVKWRTCEHCQREWPEDKDFFARSPKRRNGRVLKVYLRRRCRICPRRI